MSAPRQPQREARPRAERALDLLNLVLSDIRYGLGAYLGVYLLSEHNWDPGAIGLAFSAGGLTGLVFATPGGALVDALRPKRGLLAGSVAVATGLCLLLPLAPEFGPVVLIGVVGALAGCIMGPALTAISLGVVGPARFARRAGRNEALFHAGNAVCNVAVLISAPFVGSVAIFAMLGVTGAMSALAAFAVPAAAIDHDAARGLVPGASVEKSRPWAAMLRSPPLLAFAGCGALFHLANAAMLPLVAQRLALLVPGQGYALTAACAITAQIVMVPTAALAGARADAWGRKPLFLAAFAALTLRAALFAAADHPAVLVAVQLLDGVGAGLIGALFPVVVADLTRGSGHFNAAVGAVGTVHGVGGALSAALTGAIAARAGYGTAFAAMAAVAAGGGVLYALLMPESRGWGISVPNGQDSALHGRPMPIASEPSSPPSEVR